MHVVYDRGAFVKETKRKKKYRIYSVNRKRSLCLGEEALAQREMESLVSILSKCQALLHRHQRLGVRVWEASTSACHSTGPDGCGCAFITHYKRLNISRNASEAEVKKAYRKAVKTCHPDKGGCTDEVCDVC